VVARIARELSIPRDSLDISSRSSSSSSFYYSVAAAGAVAASILRPHLPRRPHVSSKTQINSNFLSLLLREKESFIGHASLGNEAANVSLQPSLLPCTAVAAKRPSLIAYAAKTAALRKNVRIRRQLKCD